MPQLAAASSGSCTPDGLATTGLVELVQQILVRRLLLLRGPEDRQLEGAKHPLLIAPGQVHLLACLLYTSDAADE